MRSAEEEFWIQGLGARFDPMRSAEEEFGFGV